MKRFVQKKCMAFLLILVATCFNTFAQDNIIDEVVWVVGGEPILKSDIEEARSMAEQQGRIFKRDPYCEIAEELAINKLYLHQAQIDSIEVSESDVIRQVQAEMNRLTAMRPIEKWEEDWDKSASEIKDMLRNNIREMMIVQQMKQKLVGDIKVTPSEVRRFFKTLPQDKIPYIPTQVEVQIITNEPKIPQSEIDDVKRKLREFTERVTKGEADFSTLALLYSEDKGSALKGGELGFMGKGALVPEYANVAFNLKDPKKVSKIVKSEFGYHIIQLIEKRGDRINTRHILLKPKVPQKSLDDAKLRLDSIANDIRNKKFSFGQAALGLSYDKSTRNNHGLMPNPRTSTSKFEMQQLPQEIARVVDNMKVSEISDAFQMISQKTGKEICAIVKLKSRTDGHKALITEDYQNLKELVIQKRREEMLEKWIVEKQKRTYIRINDNWKNCDFQYPGWIK